MPACVLRKVLFSAHFVAASPFTDHIPRAPDRKLTHARKGVGDGHVAIARLVENRNANHID